MCILSSKQLLLYRRGCNIYPIYSLGLWWWLAFYPCSMFSFHIYSKLFLKSICQSTVLVWAGPIEYQSQLLGSKPHVAQQLFTINHVLINASHCSLFKVLVHYFQKYSWTRHVPFLPTYQPKRLSCFRKWSVLAGRRWRLKDTLESKPEIHIPECTIWESTANVSLPLTAALVYGRWRIHPALAYGVT